MSPAPLPADVVTLHAAENSYARYHRVGEKVTVRDHQGRGDVLVCLSCLTDRCEHVAVVARALAHAAEKVAA